MTDVKRRVSFKPSHGNRGNGRITEGIIRAHLNDDDEAMGGDTYNGDLRTFVNNRKNGIRRRSGSPIPRVGQNGNMNRQRLVQSNTTWYEVKIPYGHKYDKEFILRSIQQAITPNVFIPLYWRVIESAALFYVEDFKIAELIQKANRTIETPDRRRLILLVRNSQPNSPVNDQLKERMKQAMQKRYNPATKALNLEKFHADPDLSDIFCALARPQIILAAVDIISEHIPELEALNLNDNKLYMLDHLRSMANKIPNLKVLYLAKNKIPYINTLDSLKALKLQELNLEDNPLRQRYEDQTLYVSEVRKRFPKVIKLDNIDLPPPISFDIPEDDQKQPPAKASFLANPASTDLVRQFLEQYYTLFDSDNRQPLLEAYHEHALFSLTVNTYHQNNQQKLGAYVSANRNIKHKTDLDTRCRLLKQSRLQVVSYLSELPPTKHDVHSFAVDLTFFTPQMLLLTVTGVFKERKPAGQTEPLRSFHRTMVIVPVGGGFCIRNDMLHINNTVSAQDEKCFKEPAPAVPTPAAPVVTANVAVPVVPPTTAPDDNTKLQMVQTLAVTTGMNLEWSRRCLQETNWDYQRAEFSFRELQKLNQVPQEAFIKQ